MPPTIHQSSWIYGISDAAMSGYQDDGSNPASLIKLQTTDQQAAQIAVNTGNNEGESTGNDWPDEQWTESHDVNIPFSVNPSLAMARRLLNAALGGKATSSPAAGVSKDVYSPMDAATSRQLPAYWIGERAGTAHDGLYPSCVLEKATFKGDGAGKLNISGNFRGSGKQILDAAVPINNETNKYYLKNSQSKIVRATAATPGTPVKTYACGLKSWMLDIDNAHDQNQGYDPGCGRFYTAGDEDSGMIRSYHLFGRRKYTGQFVIDIETSAPELAILRAQGEIDLKMGMYGKTISTTYKNMLEIEMHLAHYRAVEIGNQSGFTTLQISVEAFFNAALNKILSVTVQYPTGN